MSGRLGDLSAEQSKALEEFKKVIAEKNLYDPAQHDDHHLLRFMRARKFDVLRTTEMWTNCQNWRKEKEVDKIYESFVFEEQAEVQKIYPRFYHKTDKQGRPIYIEILGKLDLDQLFKITTRERLEKFFIYEYERLIRVRLPACSQQSAAAAAADSSTSVIETSFTILDLKNCSVMQALKIKDVLQLIIQIGQNYYPETMGMTFIINAPWLFDTIWSVVKIWMDEVTVKKIQIFKSGKDYAGTLFTYCDPDCIPFALGGSCQCPEGCESSDVGPWKNKK